jgi:hypothetical protein
MSTLVTNQIIKSNNSPILNSNGNVVQLVRVRSDNRTTYSSATAGNGTTVADLNMTITPRSSSNLLICTWFIFFEVHHDNIFLVHRDGALPTAAGYEGYNNLQGNSRFSGLQCAPYDNANNNDTTPHMAKLVYYDIAGSTTARTYAPAVRSSSATAYTFYLNRVVQNTGADNDECGVSFGRIMEISQ